LRNKARNHMSSGMAKSAEGVTLKAAVRQSRRHVPCL